MWFKVIISKTGHGLEEKYWIRGRLDCGQLKLEVMAADMERNIAVEICPLKPFPTFCRI